MTCAVSSGEDVVLKKMLYLYITTYAQHNPDLTLLTINLLTKDCKDQDPTIRGLALRSLCQLRLANLIEYIVSAPVPRNMLNSSGIRSEAEDIPGTHVSYSCKAGGARVSVLSGAVELLSNVWVMLHLGRKPIADVASMDTQPDPTPPLYIREIDGLSDVQMSPIQQGLRDAHPYVRRTAVMGVLKVYHLDESGVRNAGEKHGPSLTPWSAEPSACRIHREAFAVAHHGGLPSRPMGEVSCCLRGSVLQACLAHCKTC